MKLKTAYLLVATVVLMSCTASAKPITIDTVLVGDVDNANDSSTGFGEVSYNYHIGTTAVTNAQYTAFLNSVASSDPYGLWNPNMESSVHGGISRSGSDGNYTYSVRTAESGFNEGQSMGDMPVNYVTFWDAARFTNWLTTGDDTENGVYELTPDGIANNTVTRNEDEWNNGGVALTSENEWYKAAYYDPTLNDGDGGYWLYPTRSDNTPTATIPNSENANSANFDGVVDTVSPVGGYTLVSSHYGTFDQAGNVWEWNEAKMFSDTRGRRGGSFFTNSAELASSFDAFVDPDFDNNDLGFRVSSLEPIPEPSTFAFGFGFTALAFAVYRRIRTR